MRILILNTCSTLNRGDAAIVLGQIRLLKKYCPGAHIAITSKTPALDRAFYTPLGVEILAPLTPALSLYRGVKDKIMGSTQALASWADRRRLIQVLQHSDLILSCGGGYFYSYRKILPGTTFWQNVIQSQMAASLGRPLAFLPQSFGPFGSSLARRGVKHLLEERSVLKVFAREEISQQLLHRMLSKNHHARIALCPDMAFYLAEDASQAVPKGGPLNLPQPILAMNLREWTFPEAGDSASPRLRREEYLNALTMVAHFFIQRYQGSVVVVPQALGPDPSEDDRGICMEFCQRVRRRISDGGRVQFRDPDTSSLTGFMGLVSQAALLVGTRLHSCILALLAGTPIISIGYQYKSQGTLDMLGLGRFNTGISALSTEHLLALTEEIMNHHQEIQAEIRQSLNWACTQIDEQVSKVLTPLGN
jgi:colanic acid/amylovoran biosynthesis protein